MRIILSICALLTTASALSMHTMRVKTLLPLFSRNTTLSNSVANNLMRYASTSKSKLQDRIENLINGGCSNCDTFCMAEKIKYMQTNLRDKHPGIGIEDAFPRILTDLPGCSEFRDNRKQFVNSHGKIDKYYKQVAYVVPIIAHYQEILKTLNEKLVLSRSEIETSLYKTNIDNVEKIIATLSRL